MNHVVKTVCGMCGADNCGLDVYVEGDRIIDIKGMREFPVNQGRLCPQARASIEFSADPTRLKYPLRRTGDGWERISWDQVLDIIAEKLVTLKTQYGAHTLAVYQGRALLQFIRDGWVQRFMNLFGTPNLVRNEHMCAIPNELGECLTYGTPSMYYGFDPERMNCVLLWGSNPVTSHAPMIWSAIVQAQKRGAKLIVIDPRKTKPAAQANLHASLRPGTDAALALGIIHIIIEEKLYDVDFCEKWTIGLEQLGQRASGYPPAKVSKITGVPADLITQIARLYALTKPAYLDVGNALEHHSNSGQTIRAVMTLRALTGNLDVPGGHILPQGRIPLADVKLAPKRPSRVPILGSHQYPLLTDMAGFVPGDSLVESLLNGKPYQLRAMIMGGGNPILTWPNTTVMRKALERLDFLVVLDLYLTETADMADIVLPAADPFERTQLIVRFGFFGPDKPTSYLMLRKQILDPGERRSDWWFWHQLALRMGYDSYYPWKDISDAIDYQLEPVGISVKELEENPSGLYCGERVQYRRYESDGFPTPTGKVEFYSHVLEAYGYDPLPAFVEPAESPVSTPELALKFPLILNAGRRVSVYTHSRHRSLPSLRAKEPDPVAEIHPQTAAKYGIADGDQIVVESPRGSIELKSRITESMRPNTVSVLHGWSQANANQLTDHVACDPIFACPPLRAGLCRIRKRNWKDSK